jgi:hypothetical protein
MQTNNVLWGSSDAVNKNYGVIVFFKKENNKFSGVYSISGEKVKKFL